MAVEKSDVVNLFLRVSTVKPLVLLLDEDTKWYVSTLAKHVDTTYLHLIRLIQRFEEMGLVVTKKDGRVRYVELTDKGKKLAEVLVWTYRRCENV